jgi:hypothetical protein
MVGVVSAYVNSHIVEPKDSQIIKRNSLPNFGFLASCVIDIPSKTSQKITIKTVKTNKLWRFNDTEKPSSGPRNPERPPPTFCGPIVPTG